MNLFLTKLHVRYETTPRELQLVLEGLREFLLGHPKVSPDPARVRFVVYGDSSLEIEIFAFIGTHDWNEFLAIQKELNFKFKDLVEGTGTGFAFP